MNLVKIGVDDAAAWELRALKLELSRKAGHTIMMSETIRILLETYRKAHANDLDVETR